MPETFKATDMLGNKYEIPVEKKKEFERCDRQMRSVLYGSIPWWEALRLIQKMGGINAKYII